MLNPTRVERFIGELIYHLGGETIRGMQGSLILTCTTEKKHMIYTAIERDQEVCVTMQGMELGVNNSLIPSMMGPHYIKDDIEMANFIKQITK